MLLCLIDFYINKIFFKQNILYIHFWEYSVRCASLLPDHFFYFCDLRVKIMNTYKIIYLWEIFFLPKPVNFYTFSGAFVGILKYNNYNS